MGRAKRSLTRGERNCEWIERHCRVPEGRLVGQPVQLRAFQREVIRRIYDNPAGTRRAIISFGRKNAKALALDTPIPTPKGWRTIADIGAGDAVFGADGRPCTVLATSKVFVGKPCYRVSFSDGTSVVASGDHLWATKHRYRPWAKTRVNGSGFGGRPVVDVVTTDQIAASVRVGRADGGVEYNHRINVAGALDTPDVDVPLDPYLFGAWLGDGYSSSATLCAGDQDKEHFVAEVSRVVNGEPITRRGRTVWSIGLTTGRGGRRDVKIQAILRRLGVLQNKHVPDVYLWSGTEQRRALLQGLMDTDGTITPTGLSGAVSCAFVSMSERLASDVVQLVRSLGIKATLLRREAKLNGNPVGVSHHVQFTAWADDRVFRLERKLARLQPRPTTRRRSGSIAIVGCDPVDSVPTKCLMVDSPDHLFLAGHGLTPTHNTSLSAFLLLLHLCGPEARRNSQLFSAAQSREQAAILFALAAKCVRMSPDLSQYVTVRESGKTLACDELGTLYRALSAEASTAFGLSPVFVVHDELGQVRGPRSELFEALETASAAQEEPLSIVISTQAPNDADLLSVLIDDAAAGTDPRTVLCMFSAPVDADPFSDEAIRAANPAFDEFMNRDEVRQQAAEAQRMKSRQAAYRNLVLNQRVETRSPFVGRDLWRANEGDPEPYNGAPVTLGLDLSSVSDLTALVATWRGERRTQVRAFFWTPEQGLVDRARRDRVPYDVWARDGYLLTTPGASIDYEHVAAMLLELCSEWEVRAMAFDRWRIDQFKGALSRQGATEEFMATMQPFGQGFQSMAPALDALERELLAEHISHGGHPVLTMCAANAVVLSDPAGNRKLDKAKSTGRIDGMVALAMAVGAMPAALKVADVAFAEVW